MMASGSIAVAEYRLRNMWKWKRDILIYGLGSPFLYLASIGLGVGALVDRNGTGIDGVPYLTFLAPALLAAAAIQGGQDEAIFPVLSGFLWHKIFLGMHATSLRTAQIVNGLLIAAAARAIFTAAAYWLVLLGFGAVDASSGPILIGTASCAGIAFSALVMSVASRVEHDDGFFSIFGRFVVTPMFLFSGTFYPLSSLPLAVQWIGWISPLWHATELGRALSYGAGTLAPVFWVHILFLTVITVVGLQLTYRQFARRLVR